MTLKILKLNLLKNISFWNFEKARKCPAAILDNVKVTDKKCTRKSHSRVQLVGILFHELYASFLRNEIKVHDYDSFLNKLESFKLKYGQGFNFEGLRPLDQWSEVESIFEFLANHDEVLAFSTTSKISFEKKLTSKDGYLTGNPDILINKNEKLILIENKSGSLYLDGALKDEYVRQLHFYSKLVYESYGTYPEKIILRSLKDGEVEVIFDESLVENLNTEALRIISIVNREIESGESFDTILDRIAAPNEKSCTYCNLRILCNPYFKNVESFENKENRYCLIGEYLCSTISESKAYCTVTVSSHNGNVNILNVPSGRLDSLTNLSTLAFYDLSKKNINTYEYGKNSSVLTYE